MYSSHIRQSVCTPQTALHTWTSFKASSVRRLQAASSAETSPPGGRRCTVASMATNRPCVCTHLSFLSSFLSFLLPPGFLHMWCLGFQARMPGKPHLALHLIQSTLCGITRALRYDRRSMLHQISVSTSSELSATQLMCQHLLESQRHCVQQQVEDQV